MFATDTVTERLYTIDPDGFIALTEAGYDVIADAARRATGCTMAVVDAVTAEICAPGVRLVDLVETAAGYSPRIDIQHHGHIAGTLVCAFNAANAALGLTRRVYVPRPSGRAEVAKDALRRIADLDAHLRPGGAGNEGDLEEAEDAARRAVEIARAALDETTEITRRERHPHWDATHGVCRVEYVCDACGHAWSEIHHDEPDVRCPRCDTYSVPLHVETLGGEVV